MKTLRIDGKDYQADDAVADFCKATADRAEATEKAKADSDKVAADLLAATGKQNASEAIAMIAGLSVKAAKVDELSAQVAKHEADKKSADIKAMLDTATKDGRLPPAKRAELEAAEGPAFAKDPASLKVFLDCLPVVQAVTAEVKPKSDDKPGEPVVTPELKKIATQLGLDPTAVAKHQAEMGKQ